MENVKNEKIGFVGLGIMGRPMVRNLIKAGFSPLIYNRRQTAIDEMTDEGAVADLSAQEVAEKSEVVITMLPDTPDVETVVMGETGVLIRCPTPDYC